MISVITTTSYDGFEVTAINVLDGHNEYLETVEVRDETEVLNAKEHLQNKYRHDATTVN